MTNINSGYSETKDGEIDFSYYFFLIKTHVFQIFLAAAVVAVVAYFAVKAITPVYRATATMMLEETKLLSIEELYSAGRGSDFMRTQIEILKSRDIARRVVEKLNLVDTPEYNPYHAGRDKKFSLLSVLKGNSDDHTDVKDEDILNATVDAFWDSLTVSAMDRSQLVNISIESTNPEIASRAANTIAQVYIERELESKLAGSRQATEWLQDRMISLKESLNESERRLQNFRDENDVVEIGDMGTGSLIGKEMDLLSQKLLETRSLRLDVETVYKQLKALKSYKYESLAGISFIMGDEIVQHLREAEVSAEFKVRDLENRYGDKHPKMISAKSELDSAHQAVLSQMKRVAAGVESSYAAAHDKEKALQAEFDAKRNQARNVNKIEFTLNEYRREVQANQGLYDTFFSRIRETTEAGNLQASNARLVDPAVIPDRPVKPKVLLVVIAAFAGAMGMGLVVVLGLDFLNATLRTPNDVDRKIGMPLLGVIPWIATGDAKSKKAPDDSILVRAFVNDDAHGFTESIRTLRTSLTLAGLESSTQVILFTSSIPGEGKTTTSTNLAEAFAQMEKTLLIDADMRRPTMAKKLGLLPGSRGLSSAVAYPDTLDECIHHIDALNLDVIPAGPIPPNPLELLASKNFQALLQTLRGRYQRIIIDSAPTRLVSDALYLSTLVDGVVYVVKADSTRDKLVKSSISRLVDSNARVLGVLLNQLDVEKAAVGYGYGYYSGYYEAYGYTSDKEA